MARVDTLDTLQTAALRAGNLPLFDAITSEQQLGNGSLPENHLVRHYVFECYVCGAWQVVQDAKARARLHKQGCCEECRTHMEYLTLAVGTPEQRGLIQQQAEELPPDSPERQELREQYRHDKRLLDNMHARRQTALERGRR